jgi:ABC-type amino acid transport system permease subunit
VRQLAKEKDMTLTLALVLALIALVCGILMLVAGRWSKWPLAAIAIICLAVNQSGLIKM